MMVCAETYVSQFRGASYEEMIKERDSLIREIRRYEKDAKTCGGMVLDCILSPAPETRYQMNLEYLSALCSLMEETYNRDYVWGDKSLSDGSQK